MNLDLKYRADKATDRALCWIAFRLPKRLAMWVYVRVLVHATTGQYSNTVVPEITAADALKRWPSQ